jgi:hypothetical protein
MHVNDAIGPVRRVRSMRDDNRRHAAQMLIESIQQTLLGQLVERRRAFIEDQNARILQQRTTS